MKTKIIPLLTALALCASLHQAAAQGTAFTYQGKLNNGVNPVNGTYDLTFSLYNAGTGGAQTGSTVTDAAVGITNGLFTVSMDFGAVLNGTTYWLQIGVRTNGNGAFTALSPRQQLTPTPYSITAENISGTVPLAQLPATVSLLGAPGNNNFFAGQSAGNAALTGSYDIAVGEGALELVSSGSYNTADGAGVLLDNSTGSYNSGFGAFAMQYNTTGSYNTASGAYALSDVNVPLYVIGSGNTADGAFALEGDESGSNNVAVGYGALQNETADSGVVAVGYQALQNDSGSGGFLSIGSANTGIGYQSLQANTSGSANTAVGYLSLWKDTVGYNNTALGVFAMFSNTGGNNNTALGDYALSGLTSGSGNIAIGVSAGSSLTSGNNNIYIGSAGVASDNNAVRIGDTATQVYLPSLNLDPNGQNIGNVNSNALTFGVSSGEGIASKRSNGATNRFDLEFWTDFAERMKIAQNGNVGIKTDNPTAALDVNGEFAVVEGLSGVRCYLGDDGNANDVQLGSLKSGITAVSFYNAADSTYMHLYCSSITIEGGADLAEPFAITKADQPVTEGDVVVIDEANPGQLKLTNQPYDTRVAGVVSGANGINPGIQMHQTGLLEGGKNVALTGRVYVQADTSNGAIRPGDLLTTSSTPGQAMKVTDHARAAGAILGKAMTSLSEGKGMVLVLVTLQ